jgi:hypothetical protein
VTPFKARSHCDISFPCICSNNPVYLSAGNLSVRQPEPKMTQSSRQRNARLAGLLYLLSLLTAIIGEFVVHGSRGYALGLVAVACYIAVTLLLYFIFKPVNPTIALLAISSNLIALTLEALRFQPHGIDIAMVFHGLYCLLIGYLIIRSRFVPQTLGVLMVLAGIVWLVYLSRPLASSISPWNTAFGLLAEGLLCLWLLLKGINPQQITTPLTT